MARYRKYDVRISLDEKVRRLTPMAPSGAALWYYILSMPETSMVPGLCRVGRAAMAEALKWSLEEFDQAFAELFAQGLAKADWDARVVWIPNVVTYDPPANPNVVLGWAAHWDEIPDCPLKAEARARFLKFFTDLAEAKRLETKSNGDPSACLNAFNKACPDHSTNSSSDGLPNGSENPRAHARDRSRSRSRSRNRKQEQEQEVKAAPRAGTPKPRQQREELDLESEFCLGVESSFQRATQTSRAFSPMEGRLISGWYARGIPLWMVQEVLADVSGRKNAKKGKPLAYYTDAVEERFDDHQRLMATASQQPSEPKKKIAMIDSPSWTSAMVDLASRVEHEELRTWLSPLIPTDEQDGTLTLTCPSDHIKKVVDAEFLQLIEGASGKKIFLTT